MRRKIGTALHEHLVVRLKEISVREGRAMNELIEEALERYLATLERRSGPSLVQATAGKYKVSPEDFKTVMEEDFYVGE